MISVMTVPIMAPYSIATTRNASRLALATHSLVMSSEGGWWLPPRSLRRLKSQANVEYRRAILYARVTQIVSTSPGRPLRPKNHGRSRGTPYHSRLRRLQGRNPAESAREPHHLELPDKAR